MKLLTERMVQGERMFQYKKVRAKVLPFLLSVYKFFGIADKRQRQEHQ